MINFEDVEADGVHVEITDVSKEEVMSKPGGDPFVKMCAEANLDWTPQAGMWIVQKENFENRGVIFAVYDEFVWAGNFYPPDPLIFKNTLEDTKIGFFPLWSQEELQKRLGFETYELLDICAESDGIMWRTLHDYATSMEQLWLAFVMHEKSGKFWDFVKQRWIKR